MTTYSTRQAIDGLGASFPVSLLDDAFSRHPSAGGSLRRLLEGLAATARPWEVLPEDSIDMAVHAALLHTGRWGNVLYFGGTYHADYSYVHDVGANEIRKASTSTVPIERDSPFFGFIGSDLFCCGHAFLHSGELLVAGGQLPDPFGDSGDEDQHQHGGMAGGGERGASGFCPNSSSGGTRHR